MPLLLRFEELLLGALQNQRLEEQRAREAQEERVGLRRARRRRGVSGRSILSGDEDRQVLIGGRTLLGGGSID